MNAIEKRLEQFDRSAKENRITLHSEMSHYARKAGKDGEELVRRHIAIDEVGPWEQAARRAVAEGHDAGHAVQALMAAFLEAPRDRQAQSPAPPITLEGLARTLADAWEADHSAVDAESLEPELRAAVREALQSRRKSNP